jgi:arylsulfatase A-like enzyme
LTGDDFVHEQVLPHLTRIAIEFIDTHMNEEKTKPFFLYFPLPAPHTPILPTAEFKGRSGTNPYGDFMLQVDWTVGQVLEALDRHGIKKETLVIFTSDNGCSPEAEFEELATFGHYPGYQFRGAKADIYEGGHHVPFVASWPGKISPGTSSAQVICLTDLLATVAAITGHTLGPGDGVDSYNLLPVLLHNTERELREATVHHSINGSFAIRKGKWKLIMCPGSGGWSSPLPGSPGEADLPPFQLYDLENDMGESHNLIGRYPEVESELLELLAGYILSGRSTPGPDQPYTHTDQWPGIEWMDDKEDIWIH